MTASKFTPLDHKPGTLRCVIANRSENTRKSFIISKHESGNFAGMEFELDVNSDEDVKYVPKEINLGNREHPTYLRESYERFLFQLVVGLNYSCTCSIEFSPDQAVRFTRTVLGAVFGSEEDAVH